MPKIKRIIAREILDSRGIPTVESIVELDDASVGTFSVPAGISIGKNEAVELRDNDPARYAGKGVLTCLQKIASIIAPKLIGMDSKNQDQIDAALIELDGTPNKQALGANTTLSLSGAIVRAHAQSAKMPLYQYVSHLLGMPTNQFAIPTPMFNILEGGKHAGNNIDFQEFMVVPAKANSYSRDLKIGVECYYALGDTLRSHNMTDLLGQEGGYGPILYSNLDAFKMLEEAVVKIGYKTGLDVFFSLDCAASNIKKGDSYRLKDRPVPLKHNDLADFYVSLNDQYHLISIEDPFDEEDIEGWKTLMQKLGTETLIVGDDLTTTSPGKLQKMIGEKACNAVIVKPNQIGTISETLTFTKAARSAGLKIIVSHRSGETNDDFIADFAVGVGADYVKFGAPARGERVAKYNRLLEIEHELS